MAQPRDDAHFPPRAPLRVADPAADVAPPNPPAKPASAPAAESPVPLQVPPVVDLALGAGQLAFNVTATGARALWRFASPFTELVRRPPLVPEQLQPETIANRLAEQGAQLRESSEGPIVEAGLNLVARLVETVLPRVALQKVVRQLDVEDVLAEVLDSVDLQTLLAHVDLTDVVNAIPIDAVLERIDVDDIADKVDLDRAAKRIDIEAILSRVDVDDVVARADLDKAIHRVDLAGLAREILEAVDLPEIIRESTGGVATDAVRDVRWQAMSADQAVNSAFSRLRVRGRRNGHQDNGSIPDGTPQDRDQ